MTAGKDYRALNDEEQRLRDSGIELIEMVATGMGCTLSKDGNVTDLEILQDIVEGLKWPDDDVMTISVGLAFGRVLAHRCDLEWVRFSDDWGEETSLKLRGYEYFLHPIGMMTKRVEAGEEIDLRYLYEELVRRIEEGGPQQMPTPN